MEKLWDGLLWLWESQFMFRYKMPLKSVGNQFGGGWMGVALAHSCNSFLRHCGEWKLLQLDILRQYVSQKQAKSKKRDVRKRPKDWCTNRQKRVENRFQTRAKMSLWVLTLKLGYLRLECGKVLVNIVLQATVLNRSFEFLTIQLILYCRLAIAIRI